MIPDRAPPAAPVTPGSLLTERKKSVLRYRSITPAFALSVALAIPSVALAQGVPTKGAPPKPAAPGADAQPSAPASNPAGDPPATPSDTPAPLTRAQQMRQIREQLAAQQKALDEQSALIKQLQERQNGAGPAPKAAATTPGAGTPLVDLGAPATSSSAASEGRETIDDPRQKLLIYGYLQAQYATDQASQNAIAQDGHLLNQDRFSVPRARLVAEREWKYASVLMEIDGNTNNGPAFGLQRAEASVLYRGNDNAPPEPPLVAATLGQFRVPFGDENLQSPGLRYFMERSEASRAFFPSEIDLGARLAGAISWFRYDVAATNGNPLATTFQLQDPDSAKDVVGRLGVALKPVKTFDITAGVSSLIGRGFHALPGSTKTQVGWVDLNADGIFQPGEVVGTPAVSAGQSTTFRRFGFAFDGQVNLRTRFGETQLSGALYLGNNMDRGFVVSDPTLLSRDARQIGYVISILQEAGDYLVVGFRTDYYNPDSDSSDTQNGVPVQPNDLSIRTYSPIVGLRFQRRARLMFQYDFVRDALGRDLAGIPTDLKNDRATLRLQVNL